MTTVFKGEWMSVTFLHYEIEPARLQPHVPFALDVRDGKAYVSLVAFTQQKLRLAWGGALTAWAGELVGNHHFLNVRTYVQGGIHFIAEWIPNRLALWIAPPLYGLPYRLGKLEYADDGGRVTGKQGAFEFRVTRPAGKLAACVPGSCDEFLLERYVAFTAYGAVRRRFRVEHEPWPQRRVEVNVGADSLLRETLGWWREAKFVGANFSPGVPVRIGAAERVAGVGTLTRRWNGR